MTISHTFGSDLALGPTGDIAQASGSAVGQQRVLRRLLTTPASYIWHPTYGAGLGAFIGLPNPTSRIKAIAQQQMRKEQAVARSPVPTANVVANTAGTVTLTVTYGDRITGQSVTLATPLA